MIRISPAGRSQRQGQEGIREEGGPVWCSEILWRRLERGGQKRKQLLQGKRGRTTQLIVVRNFINSRVLWVCASRFW